MGKSQRRFTFLSSRGVGAETQAQRGNVKEAYRVESGLVRVEFDMVQVVILLV